MNKKFWVAFIVVFIVFMVLDFVIHQLLLSSLYEQTKELWRPETEMLIWPMYVTGLVFSFFFVFIFKFGYKNTGCLEGLRYGLYVGLFIQIPAAFGMYSVMPIPYVLAFLWFVYGTLELMIGGVVIAAIYGKETPQQVEEPDVVL